MQLRVWLAGQTARQICRVCCRRWRAVTLTRLAADDAVDTSVTQPPALSAEEVAAKLRQWRVERASSLYAQAQAQGDQQEHTVVSACRGISNSSMSSGR